MIVNCSQWNSCKVIDDFLENPPTEEWLKSLSYETILHDGIKYPGFYPNHSTEDFQRIEEILGEKFEKKHSFVRIYRKDAPQPTFIHQDGNIGKWSGVLFLSHPPTADDGFAFWRHQKLDMEIAPDYFHMSEEEYDEFFEDGYNEEKWDLVHFVPMKFNRLVLFPSVRYHSRYPQFSSQERIVKLFFLK